MSNPSAGRTYDEGVSLIEKGDLEDATSLILEAVRMGLENPVVYTTLGDLYKTRQQHEHAVLYYTKALDRVPEQYLGGQWDSVRIFKQRAECYVALSHASDTALQQAAAEYDKYLLITDPTYDSLLLAGKTHLDAGNLQRANELLLSAEALDSTDPYLHFSLGELYERMSNVKEAKFHFSKAVQLDPDFPTPYINQAEDLIAKDDDDSILAALNLYLSVLKLLPMNGEMHIRIADLYDMIGEEYVESSKTMITRALELDLPDEKMTSAYYRRGVIFEAEAGAGQASSRDNAISDFTMCLAFAPSNIAALERRAQCFLDRGGEGDKRTAAKDYEQMVSIKGEDATPEVLSGPYFFLANWYFDNRFPSEAAPTAADTGSDILPLDSAGRVEHYLRSLTKSASCFEMCRLFGYPLGDASKERLCVTLRIKNGYFNLLGSPPDAQEAAETPRPGGVETWSPTEETACQPLPLILKMLEDFYLSGKALEPFAHSELFNEFQFGWMSVQGFTPFYENLNSLKTANDPKNKKKKK
eukprot:TRINITY_DN74585_c0_g1_i1.p1 TRINITY_DN74585_c0_g1~~TRINITY_DN74585_c0_g1_i1.p1  ORF type:complete len:612 (+),score=131.80 TRINITY_DN74585_c0_g1_i1:253-1836(+)